LSLNKIAQTEASEFDRRELLSFAKKFLQTSFNSVIFGAFIEYVDLFTKVAVMATCRHSSYGKDSVMSQTYDEAETVVKHLTAEGIEAKNVHIEIEAAKEWGLICYCQPVAVLVIKFFALCTI